MMEAGLPAAPPGTPLVRMGTGRGPGPPCGISCCWLVAVEARPGAPAWAPGALREEVDAEDMDALADGVASACCASGPRELLVAVVVEPGRSRDVDLGAPAAGAGRVQGVGLRGVAGESHGGGFGALKMAAVGRLWCIRGCTEGGGMKRCMPEGRLRFLADYVGALAEGANARPPAPPAQPARGPSCLGQPACLFITTSYISSRDSAACMSQITSQSAPEAPWPTGAGWTRRTHAPSPVVWRC